MPIRIHPFCAKKPQKEAGLCHEASMVLVIIALTAAVASYLVRSGHLSLGSFLPGWKTFSGNGFSFKYPATWKAEIPDTADIPGVQVLAEVYRPGSASNVSLVALPASDQVQSAGEFAREMTALYKSEGYLPGVEQYSPLSEGARDIEGVEAYSICGEVVAARNGTVLRLVQTFIPYGSKMYVGAQEKPPKRS